MKVNYEATRKQIQNYCDRVTGIGNLFIYVMHLVYLGWHRIQFTGSNYAGYYKSVGWIVLITCAGIAADCLINYWIKLRLLKALDEEERCEKTSHIKEVA